MKSLLSAKTSTTMDVHPSEIPHESDLAPLLAAWDLAHPDVTDPDWRHLLDEIAHPRTTRAFQSLATVAA
ncbi:hypothetical protein [Streptomyces sp. NBC_00620]|uniref:hypothetical protein n=1 Tax=unclassified Streptomyces TaxID=2593676 RepID=UPI00224E385F|nr:hypothetical protein [Streptomyces sp. NBC_00620]MCX4973423.1 hypothetical protein [Streptomyces sp. NBC_00620]WUC16882.1 hypothetical protein OG256_20770 [Streptomyces sp. NBC_00564]